VGTWRWTVVAAVTAVALALTAVMLFVLGVQRSASTSNGVGAPGSVTATDTSSPTDTSSTASTNPSPSPSAGTASGTTSPSSAATTPPYSAVVLAAGVRMSLRCSGTGSPTVVLISDLAQPASTWDGLTADVEATARVCVYDRPGVGQSPPRTSPHQVVDAGLNARELATLLSVTRQPGPYLLVGEGYGALVARAFDQLHPSLVRGLLLGGDEPDTSGSTLFWTEAAHRVAVTSSLVAAGPTPASSPQTLVVTKPGEDPATLATELPGLLDQLRN
jgi:pimeloyl-ACP methyl ester carboxylesterase